MSLNRMAAFVEVANPARLESFFVPIVSLPFNLNHLGKFVLQQ
jgi:hypothetical protein